MSLCHVLHTCYVIWTLNKDFEQKNIFLFHFFRFCRYHGNQTVLILIAFQFSLRIRQGLAPSTSLWMKKWFQSELKLPNVLLAGLCISFFKFKWPPLQNCNRQRLILITKYSLIALDSARVLWYRLVVPNRNRWWKNIDHVKVSDIGYAKWKVHLGCQWTVHLPMCNTIPSLPPTPPPNSDQF